MGVKLQGLTKLTQAKTNKKNWTSMAFLARSLHKAGSDLLHIDERMKAVQAVRDTQQQQHTMS